MLSVRDEIARHRRLEARCALRQLFAAAGDVPPCPICRDNHFRRARTRDQELFERNKSINGVDHPRTLGTGTNLGRDMREAGEYQASAELLEEIYRQHDRVFGPTSYRTLSAKANWAVR